MYKNGLQIYMKNKGITQKELARSMGVGIGEMSLKIRGLRVLTLEEGIKISDYLGISAKELNMMLSSSEPIKEEEMV